MQLSPLFADAQSCHAPGRGASSTYSNSVMGPRHRAPRLHRPRTMPRVYQRTVTYGSGPIVKSAAALEDPVLAGHTTTNPNATTRWAVSAEAQRLSSAPVDHLFPPEERSFSASGVRQHMDGLPLTVVKPTPRIAYVAPVSPKKNKIDTAHVKSTADSRIHRVVSHASVIPYCGSFGDPVRTSHRPHRNLHTSTRRACSDRKSCVATGPPKRARKGVLGRRTAGYCRPDRVIASGEVTVSRVDGRQILYGKGTPASDVLSYRDATVTAPSALSGRDVAPLATVPVDGARHVSRGIVTASHGFVPYGDLEPGCGVKVVGVVPRSCVVGEPILVA